MENGGFFVLRAEKVEGGGFSFFGEKSLIFIFFHPIFDPFFGAEYRRWCPSNFGPEEQRTRSLLRRTRSPFYEECAPLFEEPPRFFEKPSLFEETPVSLRPSNPKIENNSPDLLFSEPNIGSKIALCPIVRQASL